MGTCSSCVNGARRMSELKKKNMIIRINTSSRQEFEQLVEEISKALEKGDPILVSKEIEIYAIDKDGYIIEKKDDQNS
jgi:hypothetical protein